MRFLGIDFGTQRVGLALSDEEGRMAFPLRTVSAGPHLLEQVVHLVKEEKVGTVVMGDSRNYKGEENPVMQKAHVFRQELQKELNIPVHLESEVLTTQEAARFQGRTPLLDASSAAIILQSFLDKQQPHEQ